jgi:hypothetical protein
MSVPSIKSSTDECNELKNITYKTMMTKSFGEKKNTTLHNNNKNISNIEVFLDKERKINKREPWNKIDKTEKIKQLNDFVDSIIEIYNLTETEITELKEYLSTSLDKKKLLCVKDVQYDKLCGKIKAIPCLHYNSTSRKFTLKRSEKRVSTLKSLGKGNSLKAEESNALPKDKTTIQKHKKVEPNDKEIISKDNVKNKVPEKARRIKKKPIAIDPSAIDPSAIDPSAIDPSAIDPSAIESLDEKFE